MRRIMRRNFSQEPIEMRILVLAVSLLSALVVRGDNVTSNLSARSATWLKEASLGFGFIVAFSPETQKPAHVSPELLESAENRLRDVAAPRFFGAAGTHPPLTAYLSTPEHPDAFIVSTESDGDQIKVLISEFRTDFNIIPAKPSPQNDQTARQAFHAWCSRLLNPAWQTEDSDDTIEVRNFIDFFVVRKVFRDDSGVCRLTLWTKSESLKMALDKDGRWVSLSVEDLPDSVSSMPQGERFRAYGSWFNPAPPITQEMAELDATGFSQGAAAYYRRMGELIENIADNSGKKGSKMKAADLFAQLLKDVLSTETRPDGVQTEDLDVLKKLILRISNSAVDDGQRVDLCVLASALGRVRAEQIKGYEWKTVSMNVSPPGVAKGLWMSGMDPAAIEDPVDRAGYEEAIRKNQENDVLNSRQSMLSEIDRKCAYLIIDEMKKAFRRGELSGNAVQDCMNAARLSDDEKKAVLHD